MRRVLTWLAVVLIGCGAADLEAMSPAGYRVKAAFLIDAVRNAGLKRSAQLLRPARIVGPGRG